MVDCTIKILDEVNVKFTNLAVSTRHKLVNKYKYRLPYAQHLPSVRLGRWDGTVSVFDLGGRSYVNLLEEIIPILIEDGYDLELEDHRTVRNFEFQEVTANLLSHKTWPKGHRLEGQPIILADHQVTAINEYLRNPQSIQELPTSSGKTVVTASLSMLCEPYGNTVVIVPNKYLVKQTLEDYTNLGLDVGVYFGDKKELGHKHTICTWQSLNNIFKNKKENEEARDAAELLLKDLICVMVDECHASKADVLKSMLTGPFANIPLRWGLTGTIPKEDYEFMYLYISIGQVVNKIAAKELQDKGILANCEVNILQTQDVVAFKSYQEELKYLVTNADRLQLLADRIQEISKTGNTIVLVDRLECGQQLSALIPNSSFVSGKDKIADRKEHYDEMASEDNLVKVATYGILSTGVSINRIFNLVLIEPGKSFIRVIQSIGRGLRVADDKSFVNIFDVCSTCKYSKRHLTKRKVFYRDAKYNFKIEKIN